MGQQQWGAQPQLQMQQQQAQPPLGNMYQGAWGQQQQQPIQFPQQYFGGYSGQPTSGNRQDTYQSRQLGLACWAILFGLSVNVLLVSIFMSPEGQTLFMAAIAATEAVGGEMPLMALPIQQQGALAFFMLGSSNGLMLYDLAIMPQMPNLVYSGPHSTPLTTVRTPRWSVTDSDAPSRFAMALLILYRLLDGALRIPVGNTDAALALGTAGPAGGERGREAIDELRQLAHFAMIFAESMRCANGVINAEAVSGIISGAVAAVHKALVDYRNAVFSWAAAQGMAGAPAARMEQPRLRFLPALEEMRNSRRAARAIVTPAPAPTSRSGGGGDGGGPPRTYGRPDRAVPRLARGTTMRAAPRRACVPRRRNLVSPSLRN